MWVILGAEGCKIDTFSYFAPVVMQCTYTDYIPCETSIN